ncbi:alpha/beta fold hydrolase [Micromonospora sp. NPDC005806]|uniref:alpha/beta fold hydrolase n=1 Tax=Micromonospora sp. NPDC005806 TaxID=3364234 RepID=UPI0036A816B1
MSVHTRYRTAVVDGPSIFYREAGPPDAPVLLLLHGFPSSSRMFEPLLARLADRFRLIAPDYPGFGHSDAPAPSDLRYTFDRIAEVMSRFAATVGVDRYLLYVQDYGGPVGFRMALAEPARLTRHPRRRGGLAGPWLRVRRLGVRRLRDRRPLSPSRGHNVSRES